MAGNVEFETVNGEVTISFDRLGGGQSVAVTSVNGSITLRLPADADARVEAETVNGKIKNDFGLQVEKGQSSAARWKAGSARAPLASNSRTSMAELLCGKISGSRRVEN
jgi:DUF4097 and DUF4098 domain-containing protein YvlB